MSWRIRGSYFESCNCDPICPCRRIDGVPGGRSTHGECLGLLSWLIEEGGADGVDLGGQPVALASRYSDDEEGSPWTWILYLDSGASDEQRDALEGIYTGRLAGDAEKHFPWAWKASELVAVRPVEIEVEHTRRRHQFAIRAADASGSEHARATALKRLSNGAMRENHRVPRSHCSSPPLRGGALGGGFFFFFFFFGGFPASRRC